MEELYKKWYVGKSLWTYYDINGDRCLLPSKYDYLTDAQKSEYYPMLFTIAEVKVKKTWGLTWVVAFDGQTGLSLDIPDYVEPKFV